MEERKLDLIAYNLKQENNIDKINKFISEYKPFIIKTISEVKGSYVDIRNDEEVSIGLMAFDEAIKRYEYDKGRFLSFAKVVISSRLKNYFIKESRHSHELIDDNIIEEINEENEVLKEEIENFEKELLKFGMDFEILIENSPKHKDTRIRAIEIGENISKDNEIMDHLNEKKRLPITKISKKFNLSIKIIKGSKLFIIATSIIFYKKFELLIKWLK